jgi:hypothetical protein
MTALEGTMDAKVAADAKPADVTAGLAWAAAARALGGSAAVGMTPALIAATSVGTLSGTAFIALASLAVVPLLLLSTRAGRPAPAPAGSRMEHAGSRSI